MALSISAPVGPWEDALVAQGGGNKQPDVEAVQTLLTRAASKTGNSAYNPRGVDGKIARAPRSSNTLNAIYNFQLHFLSRPDRRVDVGGTTWKRLTQYEGGATAPEKSTLIRYAGNRMPFFKQFDARWADRKLGTTKSLKSAGCAITSIAMILKGLVEQLC